MYQIVIIWNTLESKGEHTDNLIAALNAVAIYLIDPTVVGAFIYDMEKNDLLFHWNS